ncbi:exodeoxyribonuclease VII small subunit [Flavobacterium sp. Sd200]|uniref:exodeoxyribonuclease VII small subunit n=1 Tax=Flavobacterium sp. Sd200 TaxID=2692211 RepID=UPI00136E06A9|nr:exodeoxyribonuclease VII small subunit [Flavobacterium sp. Sd200]MXN91710.1 exodeoxyribonuclease VII small subunit [Flavobacterium sp. Sd200]
MEQALTYDQAYTELERIAKDIENETISVDELAVKVKRAAELIAYCEAKLKDVEAEVTNIINQMDSDKGKNE